MVVSHMEDLTLTASEKRLNGTAQPYGEGVLFGDCKKVYNDRLVGHVTNNFISIRPYYKMAQVHIVLPGEQDTVLNCNKDEFIKFLRGALEALEQ
jgi:hypothetical protein